jgi:hypothetical protein
MLFLIKSKKNKLKEISFCGVMKKWLMKNYASKSRAIDLANSCEPTDDEHQIEEAHN